MAGIKEAVCNTEVVRSLNFYGMKAYKLPDVLGSRFTANKPYDIIACSTKGRFIAIEGKLIKKWQGVSRTIFQDHQPIELDGVLKRNGRAFLFLYVRIKADKKTGQKRVCKLVVFDWEKHREAIMTEGYGVALLRSQSVGDWYDPVKFSGQEKLIWPLKTLLKSKV